MQQETKQSWDSFGAVATELRDILRKTGLARYQRYGTPLRIGGSVRTIYLYYFRARMAAWIMDHAMTQHYPEHPRGVKASSMVNDLVNQDVVRVTIDIAAAAWLTIDDWRLHLQFPNSGMPEDLSYGLVTHYYLPIIRQAKFLAGQTVRTELESMPADLIQESMDFAYNQVLKTHREASKERIQAIIQGINNLGFMPA